MKRVVVFSVDGMIAVRGGPVVSGTLPTIKGEEFMQFWQTSIVSERVVLVSFFGGAEKTDQHNTPF
jgi:hypothetical protein